MPHLPKKQPIRSYAVRRIRKEEFGNDASTFYNSTAWRKMSKRYRTNNPMCEVFPGKIAQVVDHIVPIQADERGQPLPTGGAAWDERNLMAMSHKAHNIKRGKESHGFVIDYIEEKHGKIPRDRKGIINALRG